MRVVRWRAIAAIAVAAVILAGLWALTRSAPPAAQGPAATPPPPAPTPTATATPAATPPPISGATATPALPPITVEESRIRGADPSGRVQWELRAITLQVDADRQEVRLTGVQGTFLEKGQPAVTFSAPQALFAMTTRDITLTGGVRARAGDGRSVEAQEVRYHAARRVLVASGNVRLTQERMIVRADRLESDVALRRTRLTGNITVTIRE